MLFLLVQFLPLTLFVWIARSHGFTSEAWMLAFQIGGAVAVIETVLLAFSKRVMNRLILGANLFLAVGALGFLFKLDWLTNMYGRMQESALFCSVLLVGAVTTAFSSYGFLELQSTSRSKQMKYSGILLVVACLSFVLSIIFRGNVWLSGTAPFVLLIVARRVLRGRFQQTT
jgi:hypothetical protein